MIRILIVEDEQLAIQRMQRLIGRLTQDINVVGVCKTIKETIDFLQKFSSNIDLIFMDIHLGDGNSFEVFEQMKIELPVIFTTAFDQYAMKAFKQTSVDYLLKPIQQEALQESVEKYKRIFGETKNVDFDYTTLLTALGQDSKDIKKRFMVQVGDKIRYINTEDIAMFYAENKACYVISHEGKRYYVNYTLEKLVEMLDPIDFYRINRKVIVHISSIVEIIPYSKSKLLLKTKQEPGFELFISSDKIKKFKNWLNF